MARLLELSAENKIIDLPDLNRFRIGDEVIVDATPDHDRFEGVIIGIELRRVYGADRLEPCITLLENGYITDEFKPGDCRKVTPSPPTLAGGVAAALVRMADHGVPPDMQEVLVNGNVSLGVRPGALAAALAAAPAPQPVVEAPKTRISPNTGWSMPIFNDRVIREGLPDGWFIQDRLDTNEALLCSPAFPFGSQCICLRPRAISTADWLPMAQRIAKALHAALATAAEGSSNAD